MSYLLGLRDVSENGARGRLSTTHLTGKLPRSPTNPVAVGYGETPNVLKYNRGLNTEKQSNSSIRI